MSEKFSFKWKDFQSNVSRTFSLLRSQTEFCDVSLVGVDQIIISAHKLVLSSCSPYFKHILTQNKHSHPLLCLDGVSSGELQCVLDYIYQGEVQVYQEQLDRFLEVAQRLKLEGLDTQDDEQERKHTSEILYDDEPELVTDIPFKKKEKQIIETKKTLLSTTVADNSSTEEIDQKLSEYIIKGDGVYCCGYCGKVGDKDLSHMKNHVETHLDGISYSCPHCDKTFRSRNALNTHRSRHHRY